jgi:uncharacterized protein
MSLPRLMAALGLATCLAFAAPPAAAFNCKFPGLVDATKRAVCANPELARLDATEAAELHHVSGKLWISSIGALRADRDAFVNARRRCGAALRCLEAVYRAQLRLYAAAGLCAERGPQQLDCLNQTFARHREDLHRSL